MSITGSITEVSYDSQIEKVSSGNAKGRQPDLKFQNCHYWTRSEVKIEAVP